MFGHIREKYEHIKTFTFSSRRYKVRSDGKRKKITLYCPLAMVNGPTPVEVAVTGRKFTLGGQLVMLPREDLGIAICSFTTSAKEPDIAGKLTARLGDETAKADVYSEAPRGSGIKIKIEDVDLKSQRYQWRQNVLELAAKHPSLKRYLGLKSEGFPGQDSKHFRVLTAEIVAEAVCARMIGRREANHEYEDEPTDWDFYYQEFTRLMTKLLPQAHAIQLSDPE